MIRTVTVLALCLGLAPLANGRQQDVESQLDVEAQQEALKSEERKLVEQQLIEVESHWEVLMRRRGQLELEMSAVALVNSHQRTSTLERMSTLESLGFEMRLSQAEFTARRRVMERHVVELEERLNRAMMEDLMTVQLKTSIQNMERLLSGNPYGVPTGAAQGVRPFGETLDGHFRLAELAVELGARSDQVYARSGGARLERLKGQLMDVDIELEVIQAKQSALRVEAKRAEKSLKEATALSGQMGEIDLELERNNHMSHMLETALEELR